jgi:hypothetical protein
VLRLVDGNKTLDRYERDAGVRLASRALFRSTQYPRANPTATGQPRPETRVMGWLSLTAAPYESVDKKAAGRIVAVDCLAHVRRKLFDAPHNPPHELHHVLGWIAQIWRSIRYRSPLTGLAAFTSTARDFT